MLMEFTHEHINTILSLFNEGNIVQLNIKPVVVDNDRRFVINYTTLDSLDMHQKSLAIKTLNNPNCYLSRMRVTELINQFIENMATNTVTRFELEFSVIDRTTALLNTQVQFAKEANTVTDKSIKDCFDELNDIVTKTGTAPMKIDGVFRREGTGKGKKHVTITVGEMLNILQTIFAEDK